MLAIKKMYYFLATSKVALFLLLSTIVVNILGLAVPMYSIQLLNRYITIGLTPTLITLTLGAAIAILFEVMLRRQRQKLLVTVGNEIDRHYSQRVLHVFSRTRFDALSSVDMAAKREVLSAPTAVQNLGSVNNLGTLLDIPFTLLYIAMAWSLSPIFGYLGLAACLLALGFGIYAERAQRSMAESQNNASSRAQQLQQFLLSHGEALRALPMLGSFAKRWSSTQGDSLGARRDQTSIQGNMQTSVQSFGQVLTVGVYSFGAFAAVHGDLTTGALIGGNILVARAYAICSRGAYLADPALKVERVEKTLKTMESLESEAEKGVCLGDLEGKLTVHDAAFTYPKAQLPIFERLAFHVSAGQVVVIKGENGTGKTTLIKVLLGLLSLQRGVVQADGIDVKQFDQAWWRVNAGYAPQEPVLFDATLRENLVLDREISDETVLEYILELGLERFLAQDPDGLEKMVSSNDSMMAVGQRRRLALIRAVLGNPQVLFLDDPTEGLDQQGLKSVANLLNKLVIGKRTLVVASNEPFILKAADLVINMNSKPEPAVEWVSRAAAVREEADNE